MPYQTVDYDFNTLLTAIGNLDIEDEEARKYQLKIIKDELNKFFPDFKCTEIIFTQNTDNEFFGVQIFPMFASLETMMEILNPDSSIKFDHYLLEIDSKLIVSGLTADSIMAMMIHDINKLNSASLIKSIVSYADHIAMTRGEVIKREFIELNSEFFLFTIQDTARKMTSCFEYMNVDLKAADDFIRSFNLQEYYEDGMGVLKNIKSNLNQEVRCPTITLQWFMSKYEGLDSWMHKGIIEIFEDAMRLSGSKLIRRIIKQILTKFKIFANPQEMKFLTALTESSKPKKKMSLASQLKYSGLKSLEDDVYEYRMRIKNVETEDEAINIIRQINNRMGLISDYLENEELSDIDKERFYKLYDKYDDLREELSKKAVYNRKMYGLFVDYTALQQMPNNSITMNTYY